MLIVLTTVPEIAVAEALAQAMVESRLAACVQILPPMTSIYLWQGVVEKENEHLMLIKTLPEKWEEVRDFITANHGYSVPEIVAVDAAKVSEAYLTWLRENLS